MFSSSTTQVYYIKPTWCKWVLHNRHGQFGFHFLILFKKNIAIDSFSFPECAINETDSVPYVTVLEFLL